MVSGNSARRLEQQGLRAVALLPIALVCASVSVAQEEPGLGASAASDLVETPVEAGDEAHWVDTSHEIVTNRAQDIAQWMDDYFGAPVRDAERADTFIRSIFIDDWDERDGHDLKLRLRGQISLPKISERVDIFFSGEEAEGGLTEEERSQENDVGIRLNVRDGSRARLDATLSARSGPALLPGVRFRYQQPITDNSWARFTQRLQYHTKDGYRSLSNIDVNRAVGENSLLRWGGRLRYREEKDFWDWTTSLRFREWLNDHSEFPSAIEYFVAVAGRDQPENFETSYRLGVLYRRQFFRKYLFYEIEPSYNWRRDTYEEQREGVFGIVLRLEVMLDEGLVRGR